MESDSDTKLDYNLILLRHLDRISRSSSIDLMPDGQTGRLPKIDILKSEVNTLISIIPNELKDDKYYENLNFLGKQLKEKGEKYYDNHYWYSVLQANINLLARNGMLYHKKVSANLNKNKSKSNNNEIQEVWEG